MSNEEKVKAAWEWYRERFSEPHEGYAQGVYIVQIPMHNFSASTAEEARSAAAAFTDEVLAEAARMREEIAWVSGYGHMSRNCECPKCAVRNRVIARLQSLYDAHVRGLKSEALKGKE